ncbi:50S ribosomal protein L15 [Patescibacteria group bacterium]|nr:50S ribosomal protein L15 [Patescibacteria group bacterium]
MNLHTLPKVVHKRKKRLGRGHGSGKVKTSGRGTKGQKARETVRIGFEGGQLPLIRRLPFLRGKAKNRSYKKEVYPVTVSKLGVFPPKSDVTLDLLKKAHIIEERVESVKVLGGGTLSVALTVSVPCSRSAQKAIERAGGRVVPLHE